MGIPFRFVFLTIILYYLPIQHLTRAPIYTVTHTQIYKILMNIYIKDWFKSIPLVTKFLVTSTLLSGAGVSFGLLSPRQLFFAWPLVHQKFHIWRLVTPFLFAGTFSFNFLMHLVILYENCKRYERNPFSTGAGGTSADFLWMVIVGMGIFCVVGCYFELGFMSEQLLYLIMYVWSRREPDTILSFFGFKFKALYVPWVYMAFRYVFHSIR